MAYEYYDLFELKSLSRIQNSRIKEIYAAEDEEEKAILEEEISIVCRKHDLPPGYRDSLGIIKRAMKELMKKTDYFNRIQEQRRICAMAVIEEKIRVVIGYLQGQGYEIIDKTGNKGVKEDVIAKIADQIMKSNEN